MLPTLPSSSRFISSIAPHLRLSSPKLLRGLQLRSQARPKTPFSSISPLPSLSCFPTTFQRFLTPELSYLQLPRLMQHKAPQLHAQGSDFAVDGVSDEKDSILDAAGGDESGGSSVAVEASVGKDVILEAGGNGAGTGAAVSNLVVDASSNSSNLSGRRADRMREKLERGLCPVQLELEDISYQHAGHAAVRGKGDGETHFNVKIVSKEFEGKGLVKRHRLVYDLLQDELQSGLHALSIVAKTPAEVGAK